MNTDGELFKKRLIELANRAYDTGVPTFTPFMGLLEQDIFRRCEMEFSHVPYAMFGGTEGSERVMARFGDEQLCGYSAPFPIVCIKAAPLSRRFSDELTHRDILGAVMNLGIDRSTTGDIVIRDNIAYLFCNETVAPLIIDSLTRAKHTELHAEAVERPPEGELYKLKRVKINIASERLDCIVKEFLRVGRGEASELIAKGRVFINGKLCESVSKPLKSGDVVSVRGNGRFIFRETVNMTRKGRLSAEIDVFC